MLGQGCRVCHCTCPSDWTCGVSTDKNGSQTEGQIKEAFWGEWYGRVWAPTQSLELPHTHVEPQFGSAYREGAQEGQRGSGIPVARTGLIS